MSLLLQVSDTHFGTERAPVVEALLELGAAQRPDLVVLSGDITQRARRAEFDAARRLVERLAAPATLAIPGNHDVPLFNIAARLLQPYAAYARTFGADLEPSYEDEALLVVGVNTTRAHRHKHGEVSERQIERVARRLGGCPPQKLRVRPVAERLPDLVRPLWAVQAGTAVSQRVRPGAEANSVNLVRTGQGACTVERWDHDASGGRFALGERVRIALSR
jgi:predicted phosphodiesterase